MVKRMLRIEDVQRAHGHKGRSGVYYARDRGLLTAGIKIGARAVAWPEDEIAAIQAARIAGRSEEDIRALVKKLEALRSEAAA